MYIPLDHKSGVPLYIQMKDQMRLAVATGTLRPGDQLPTVRELAPQLRVNPNTVARVYRELQAEGLLSTRQGSGTYVAEGAAAVSLQEGRRMVHRRLREAVGLGLSVGLDAAELSALFLEATAEWTDHDLTRTTPPPLQRGAERKAAGDADDQ